MTILRSYRQTENTWQKVTDDLFCVSEGMFFQMSALGIFDI